MLAAMGDNRKPPRLCLAPQQQTNLPDTRAAVARALLGPVAVAVDDQLIVAAGWDAARHEELMNDPRYLIGRLHQALTALLAGHDVPAPDATARLLGDAIADAIKYRERCCPKCPADSICDRCLPGWTKAVAYRALWGELGIVGEVPQAGRLRPVTP